MIKRFIIFCLLLFFSFNSQANDLTDTIPEKAYKYIDMIKAEVENTFPELPNHALIPALIEQESCITLKHKRCFEHTSQLYTEWSPGRLREQGYGWFQLTRATRVDGSMRLDTLSDLARRYPRELGNLNWSTVKTRPDLQLKAGILLYRENYNLFKNMVDEKTAMEFAISGYNGGGNAVKTDIEFCKRFKECDPTKWWGNVEIYSLKPGSKYKPSKPLYGKRTAFRINRDTVQLETARVCKYVKMFYQ